MMKNFGILFAVLVAAGTVVTARSCDNGNMNSMCNYTEQRPWDYMMFVQSWQGTFCQDGCCKLPAGVAAVHAGMVTSIDLEVLPRELTLVVSAGMDWSVKV